MACKNCKKSILNSQKSSIPSPDCVDNDCSQDIACDGIATYSDCVTVVPALDCINTAAGEENLSDVLELIDTKLCQVKNGTVKVSVSEPDTCPGFLEDKIGVGSGLDLQVTDLGGGCEKIIISEKCWEWNSVTAGSGDGKFKGKWKNANDGVLIDNYQTVQYSNVKECIVKLRGFAFTSGVLNNIIFTLPSGKRPLFTRRFSVNVTIPLNTNPIPSFVEINNAGEVSVIIGGNPSNGSFLLSLDGIYFETD